MASTNIIGSNAPKVSARQKKITFKLFSDFLDSKLDFPKNISSKNPQHSICPLNYLGVNLYYEKTTITLIHNT